MTGETEITGSYKELTQETRRKRTGNTGRNDNRKLKARWETKINNKYKDETLNNWKINNLINPNHEPY